MAARYLGRNVSLTPCAGLASPAAGDGAEGADRAGEQTPAEIRGRGNPTLLHPQGEGTKKWPVEAIEELWGKHSGWGGQGKWDLLSCVGAGRSYNVRKHEPGPWCVLFQR